MMKIIIAIALFFSTWGASYAQLPDYILISRNTGEMEMIDGNVINIFGFTQGLGQVTTIPSPVLVMNHGDTMHIKFRNISQGAPHTIHPHGLDVDQQNDGVPHLSFFVEHEEWADYYITSPHPGTYIYHCHVVSSIHVQAGMYGLIIVKPSDGSDKAWDNGPEYDNEFAWLFSEVDTVWHQEAYAHQYWDHANHGGPQTVPSEFTPQFFLINGKTEHQLNDPSTHIMCKPDESNILRLANIGFLMQRIILPSELNTEVIATDGFPIPNGPLLTDTINLTPGERYDAMLYPDQDLQDSIVVEYIDLNTQEILNVQKVPVTINDSIDASINDIEEVTQFNVFPNPAYDFVNVQMDFKSMSKDYSLQIRDILGRIIYSRYVPDGVPSYEKRIPIRKQSMGLYTARMYQGDELIRLQKFIKSN
jgi:hypothetical protein